MQQNSLYPYTVCIRRHLRVNPLPLLGSCNPHFCTVAHIYSAPLPAPIVSSLFRRTCSITLSCNDVLPRIAPSLFSRSATSFPHTSSRLGSQTHALSNSICFDLPSLFQHCLNSFRSFFFLQKPLCLQHISTVAEPNAFRISHHFSVPRCPSFLPISFPANDLFPCPIHHPPTPYLPPTLHPRLLELLNLALPAIVLK